MFAYLTLNTSASTISKTFLFSFRPLSAFGARAHSQQNSGTATISDPPRASIGITGNLCDVRSNMIPRLSVLPTSQVGRRDVG